MEVGPEAKPAKRGAVTRTRRARGVNQVVIGYLREVDAIARRHVMPEVVAGVDLEQVETPVDRILLEVDLEHPSEWHPRHDVATDGGNLFVVSQFEERAHAGQRGECTQFVTNESGEQR